MEHVEGDALLHVCPTESQVMPIQAGWPQAPQEVLGTEQVFATGSQTNPRAQGWLAQLGSWQSTSPLQSLSLPSPQLVSRASGVPPFPEQTLQVEVPVAPFGEQVWPTTSQMAPAALPTGWHWGSAQSMRPLQLLSLPSLQTSALPPGQVEQIDGDEALQVCPTASQVRPMQAARPQAVQELLGTVQVFATGSQTKPRAQG